MTHAQRISLVALAMPFVLASIVLTPDAAHAAGTAYYVSMAGCSNSYQGTQQTHTTGTTGPWCDFANANLLTLGAGDSVLLARSSTWNVNGAPNNALALKGAGTSWSSPVALGAYGTGPAPIIRGAGNNDTDAIGSITDPSYWVVSDLEFSHAANGLTATFTSGGHAGLRINNLYVHDLRGCFLAQPAGCSWMSTGIALTTAVVTGPSDAPLLTDLEIRNNRFIDVGEAVQVWAPDASKAHTYTNVVIKDNIAQNIEGNAWDVKAITNLRFIDNYSSNLSMRAQPQGTTTTFAYRLTSALFANNVWDGVADTGSSDQSAIDAEGYIDDVSYLGNTFANTAGSGIEFLQLAPPANPVRGADDHNTDNLVDSNTFINNEVPLETVNNVRKPTGTVTNNLATRPTMMSERYAGGIAAFSIAGNLTSVASPNSSAAIYSAVANTGGASCTVSSSCWSYERYTGSAYTALFWDSPSSRWAGSGAYVGRSNQLPPAATGQWISRTWTASADGVVTIRGRVLKNDIAGGDGVLARITRNGVVIWPAAGTPQSIGYSDASGVNSNLDSVPVLSGDAIRFEVSSGSSGNATSDLTSWAPSLVFAAYDLANLLSNAKFENGTTGWTAQSGAISSSTTAHSGTGAVKVASRSAVWGSAKQDVKADLLANGQGTYWASAWARLSSGSDSLLVLVNTVDSTGSHWFKTPAVVVGTGYVQVAGGLNITWTGTLTSAIVYAQSASSTADLYLDDFSFKLAPNLLANPGFETGTTGWAAQNSVISSSTSPRSGTGALRIASRTSVASSANQDIRPDLLGAGQGLYWASTWATFTSGSDSAMVVVRLIDSAGTRYIATPLTAVGTSYAQVAGTLNLTWTGTLFVAQIYTQTGTSTGDLRLDDFELIAD
ncbi:carbohydrate binding domain-containing protein [Salinibacterium sp.]|uniref:carbohydrate binding domain-containing protein n=1 Tax=Salinibacterium sp. TaxID=1915057 RepID=UPI00286C34FD|nr:carbohydrate binding domain-containing protein [Salinibacterium sp.]